MKKEDTVDTISTSSGPAEPKAGSKAEILKCALEKHCLIRDSSLNELQEEHEFETSSVLTEQVTFVLADPPYSTRSAQGQSNSAHDIFSNNDT